MKQIHGWHIKLVQFIILLLGLTFAVTACGSGKHPAAAAVEAFVQALADKDEAQYVTLTCGDYEMDALLEYDAFSLVQTHIEGLDCQATNVDGDTAEITCQGKIIATYGNEDRTFDLSERRYQVLNQEGQWLICGY
jgi:hypothetical protein